MSLRYIALPAIMLLAIIGSQAAEVDFDKWFCDSTLRVDYTIAGNVDGTMVSVDCLTRTPRWAGRRHRLNELPLRGDAQTLIIDPVSTDTIYRHSFSTLYQEWLTTVESAGAPHSYENSVLLPMPKSKVEVVTTLFTTRGDTLSSISHIVNPADILIRRAGERNIATYNYLHRGGDTSRCIDIAIVPEGYTADEMELFHTEARAAADALLAAEPFASRKADINIIDVEVPSRESGVSVPEQGVWRDTPFGSHFSTFYSSRYLTAPRVAAIHDALAGVPYEHLIILANTDVYGGGGIYNFYTLTTARHENFKPVVVHEFGHSFGGLGDEYAYYAEGVDLVETQADYEPWQQNITSLYDFDSKWADMVDTDTPVPTPDDMAGTTPVGVFQGANYNTQLFYRPAYDCRMRTNAAKGFCPVCVRAITRMIDFYTR